MRLVPIALCLFPFSKCRRFCCRWRACLANRICAIGFYGAQRFAWEFIKPYGMLVGPFTLFHLLSAALIAYAVVMIVTAPTPTPILKDQQNDCAFA